MSFGAIVKADFRKGGDMPWEDVYKRQDKVLANIDEEVSRYVDGNEKLKVEYLLLHHFSFSPCLPGYPVSYSSLSLCHCTLIFTLFPEYISDG